MILIKNIDVYAPEYLGVKDVLITEDKIYNIDSNIDINGINLKVIDGRNKKLLPGFIDSHVHVTGGGGEGSFKTRVPEIMLSQLTSAGITTVVGMLGTDSTTRNVENLVAKTKALKEEGISAYCLTGAYELPTPTITGSIKKDIVFIEEIIGTKIAISDHRSSRVTKEELEKVTAESRVAGMMSGKCGVVTIHMGDEEKGIKDIIELVNETSIPIKHFRPTHVNRNSYLLDQCIEFVKLGGIVDLTAGIHDDLIHPITKFEKANVDMNNLTVSSDGNGSWSKYDSDGNLVKIGASSVKSLFESIVKLHKDGYDFEKAISLITKNVSLALELKNKGQIAKGFDADLVITDSNLNIETVIANGKVMIEDTKVLVKGSYE